MTTTESRIGTDIDFDKDGKQQSYLRVPISTNSSAYGTVGIPITAVKQGKGPTILITGGVHGDEYEGPIALSKLARRLTPSMVQGRVLLVPALNLPAALAGTRLSPMDGLNLNRVFPGEANGSITAMIAHYVSTVLIPMADIVVDIHSGGMTLEYLPTILMHELEDADWNRRARAALMAFGAPIALISRELDNAVYLDTIAENMGKIALSAEFGRRWCDCRTLDFGGRGDGGDEPAAAFQDRQSNGGSPPARQTRQDPPAADAGPRMLCHRRGGGRL